jgi:hypothetical protein
MPQWFGKEPLMVERPRRPCLFFSEVKKARPGLPFRRGHGPGGPPGGLLPGPGKPELLDRVRDAIRVRGGYDIRTVQELLGHKDVSTPG